jgi:ubiquinone/menaquinone biosynthesis C-methylase UbiE
MPQLEQPPISTRVRNYWERASCGTNRTAEPKHSRAYFEQIEAHRYGCEPYIHSFAQFTRWRDKDVLEVGVGAGSDFLQFARAGARAHGVDLTEESVANVAARLRLYGVQAADLRVCNAERLPYADASFDLAYSWGVIHHAENMPAVFREIYRVTRPGGHVRIMVYNLNSVHAWYRYVRHSLLKGRPWRGRRWAIHHFQESIATKAYTRREIKRLLADFPHQDLSFQFWDQHVTPTARLASIRRIVQGLTPPAMRWYLAFQFRKPE